MIPFSIFEIVRSLSGAVVFGTVMGILYELILLTVFALTRLFCMNNEVFIYKIGNTVKEISNNILKETPIFRVGRLISVYQFLFTLIFGIFYVILQYVLCDGVFRIYFALAAVIPFFCFIKFYNTHMRNISYRIISYICAFIVRLVSFILSPLYAVYKLLVKRKSDNKNSL